ncbi:flavin reductase family protein [Hyphomicrobium sp.]|uniref:flavin reductase family protein n=1 Tax=Hyphomicrobium sp. TaxID=82 RepID=UPI002BE79CC1|nr:flavin reductase family protein [Hyphomicrobium sp.]HRN89919.1 flavin reductase family protein [Hyphomicrobium sp.]HRQ27322.1 flavin reductase family protein [Hyphomicrobium sp.]
MNAEPIDSHAFRRLMRNVAGQVSIVATGAPGRRSGLTASAVCSLTDLPPMVLVCVNRSASVHDVIIENGVFSINALASDQEAVARVFSGVEGLRGEQRFSTGDWSVGANGAPILASAVCQLECRLADYKHTASHTVFFGSVIAGTASHDASPLLYHRGAYVELAPADA